MAHTMTVDEMQSRIADLEDILRVFSMYATDTWVREQAEEILGEAPTK